MQLIKAAGPATPVNYEPWKPQGHVDIEALLVWVYRDQKADMIEGSGIGLYDDEARADGRVVRGRSRCGMATAEVMHKLGYLIPSTGGYAADLHDVASLVHEKVMLLTGDEQGLVIHHARAGSRPDWKPNATPHYEPVYEPTERGQKVQVEVTEESHRYCPVIYWDTDELIQFNRDIYQGWCLCLVWIAEEIERGCSFIIETGSVTSYPWR